MGTTSLSYTRESLVHSPFFLMGAISPFIVLLIIGIIFSYIPMDGQLKRIGYIIIGITAIFMLLRFAGIL